MRAERIDAPPGPKYANLDLAEGRTVRAVDRRGKFLLLPLAAPSADAARAADDLLVIHLGMTGVLSARRPERHERVRLTLDPGPDPNVHFRDVRRFGRMLVLPGGDPSLLPTLAAIGPEPLGPDFTAAGFARALRRSRTPVKTFLLSQRPVAGVGNIYADEALWRAGVHPETPADRVPRRRVGPLRDAIRVVLRDAIAAQGTTLNDYRTVNGGVGSYRDRLAAYGHDGDPCPRCARAIVRTVVGGRGTHHCPACQRPPRARRRRA